MGGEANGQASGFTVVQSVSFAAYGADDGKGYLVLMEWMTGKDILYLTHLEKEMEKMEETLLHSIPDNFFTILTK